MIKVDVRRVDLQKSGFKSSYLTADQLQAVSCPICGSAEFSDLLTAVRGEGGSSLEQAFCRECEHRYHRNLPTQDWIAKYYSSQWESVTNNEAFLDDWRSLVKRSSLIRGAVRKARSAVFGQPSKDVLFSMAFQGVVESVRRDFEQDESVRKVLEIGCGHGYSLSRFKEQGFETYGTEASMRRVQACRALGLEVIHLPSADLKPLQSNGPFDLVYSTQVLEHVHDPDGMVRSIAELVREDGYLLINVPQNEYNLFHVAHQFIHCQGFSLRSLTVLMRKHGFVPVRTIVDTQITILAQKRTQGAGSYSAHDVAIRNTVRMEDYLDLFSEMVRSGETEFKLRFGNPLYSLWSAASGQLLHRRKFPIKYFDETEIVEADLRLSEVPAKVEYPVIFNYSGPAPVWLE